MIGSGVFEGAGVEFPTFPLTCVVAHRRSNNTLAAASVFIMLIMQIYVFGGIWRLAGLPLRLRMRLRTASTIKVQRYAYLRYFV